MDGNNQLPYHPRPIVLQRLRRALSTDRLVALSAPRGHGKTAFIQNELAPSLSDEGWKISTIDLCSPPLPRFLNDLRMIATDGNAQVLAALRDHGGAPAHQQIGQAMSWIAETSHDPHLLILENAHYLADPGLTRVVGAMHQALHAHDRQLHVLFTVSSRMAMDELFSRRIAPFRNDVYSIGLGHMQADFIQARQEDLARHGVILRKIELADCLRRQSFNLGRFDQILHRLVDGLSESLVEAERSCQAKRPLLA